MAQGVGDDFIRSTSIVPASHVQSFQNKVTATLRGEAQQGFLTDWNDGGGGEFALDVLWGSLRILPAPSPPSTPHLSTRFLGLHVPDMNQLLPALAHRLWFPQCPAFATHPQVMLMFGSYKHFEND